MPATSTALDHAARTRRRVAWMAVMLVVASLPLAGASTVDPASAASSGNHSRSDVAPTGAAAGPVITAPADGVTYPNGTDLTLTVDFSDAPLGRYDVAYECPASTSYDSYVYDGTSPTRSWPMGRQDKGGSCNASVTSSSYENFETEDRITFRVAQPTKEAARVTVSKTRATKHGLQVWRLKAVLRRAGEPYGNKRLKAQYFYRGKWRSMGDPHTTNRAGVAVWKESGDRSTFRHRVYFAGDARTRAAASATFRLPGEATWND